MPWWAWLLIAVGIIALASGLLVRRQIRFAMKVARAVAKDPRLPKPLRWAIGVALAVKVVPFPDFGIDEAILLVVSALLMTVYRPTFRAIIAETRRAQAEMEATRPGSRA